MAKKIARTTSSDRLDLPGDRHSARDADDAVMSNRSSHDGLRASRPNLFRTARRTGPRWVPAHSPSPPRDPPPQFTTLPSGRCTVRNNPLETVAYVRFRASTPFHCTRAAAVCTPNALSRNDRPARREVEAALAPVTGIGNRLCRPACSHRPTCRSAASNRPLPFRSALS